MGVVDLGVELHAVEASFNVGYRHVGAGVAVSDKGEFRRQVGHIIAMAHPAYALLGQTLEERAGGVKISLGLAVFPCGIALGGRDLAAEGVSYELAAVADAEYGYAELEYLGVDLGGGLLIHAVGAAGEDYADRLLRFYLLERGGVRLYLAIHAAFTHAPCDKLIILTAEVKDDYFFLL